MSKGRKGEQRVGVKGEEWRAEGECERGGMESRGWVSKGRKGEQRVSVKGEEGRAEGECQRKE